MTIMKTRPTPMQYTSFLELSKLIVGIRSNLHAQVFLLKLRFEGVYFSWTWYPDGKKTFRCNSHKSVTSALVHVSPVLEPYRIALSMLSQDCTYVISSKPLH